MKKITLIIILFLIVEQLSAQGSYRPSLPDITPPSPTSRIFQKFLGYPISHATGTININVPLYQLDVNSLSIPLELKYHSSGVRVQDPIGIIGHNWSLFPGFKISRTIMGKPDEKFPVTDKGVYPSTKDQIYLSSPYLSDDTYANGVKGPYIDGQYDIFQIHMPGIQASFILRRINGNDVVEMIPDKPLKITPLFDNSTNYVNTRIYAFEVQDDKGHKYIFGEAAPIRTSTVKYVERQQGSSYIAGWMLREIVFPNDEKITFTYQSVREDVPTYNDGKVVLDKAENKPIAGCYWDDMMDTSTGSDSPYWRFLGTSGYKIEDSFGPPITYINNSLVPSTITSANAIITFTYSSNMLSNIIVKNKYGTIAKSIQFTSTNLLKKVTLSGEGDYSFVYKNENNSRYAGFDWWGFYNGQPYHHSNIPLVTLQVCKKYNNENMTIGDRVNRDPNELYIDSYALTEITYPTKGKLYITYEPHRFVLNGVSRFGGGLRVKSVRSYDPVSSKNITKTYQYEGATYLGKCYPDQRSLVSTREMCAFDRGTCKFRHRFISVFSNQADVRGMSNPVWYKKITEIVDEGKSEYVYDYIPDVYGNTNYLDYDYNVNKDYLISHINRLVYPSPWLLSETRYKKMVNNEYEKTLETINTYTKSTFNIEGTVAVPFRFKINGSSNSNFLDNLFWCTRMENFAAVYGSPINSYRYSITKGWHNLLSTQKTTWYGDKSITEKTSFTYDTERPYNISQKKTLLSDGNELIEKYYYSNNTIPNRSTLTSTEQSNISQLTSQNYKTAVVQQITEKNGVRLNSVLTGYTKNMDRLMRPQTLYYQKGTSAFESRIAYKKYDRYGNPVHVIKDGSEEIIYIWGCKGQYLIAEVHGTTYDEVKENLENIISDLPEDVSDYGAGAGIYGLIVRAYVPNALVTIYVYEPLIGITGIIYPNGNASLYEYDSAGRLICIKDDNEKVLKEYQYNIKQ